MAPGWADQARRRRRADPRGWRIRHSLDGPTLGAILGLASTQRGTAQGALLLAIYSAGLGIPFLLAAFGIKSFAMLFARFKHQLQNVERAMGALLVLAGIAFITNATATMANWLIDTFPTLSRIG